MSILPYLAIQEKRKKKTRSKKILGVMVGGFAKARLFVCPHGKSGA